MAHRNDSITVKFLEHYEESSLAHRTELKALIRAADRRLTAQAPPQVAEAIHEPA